MVGGGWGGVCVGGVEWRGVGWGGRGTGGGGGDTVYPVFQIP